MASKEDEKFRESRSEEEKRGRDDVWRSERSDVGHHGHFKGGGVGG